ncbi:M28 family peptidase [Polymorphobacter fuscus]|uniref:M28 family peptidase n=1 Tax=Sandarakinorhabdus fusca TaxID=1439888 RepID=A0A7C9KWJ7_9SPHN|nr:M28 family peptidase [Polymorphobacter fuscus]KAB7647765.1 M28 family peptidase [Polymorphobacter fuscus]MQT17065.1 M28 family peptidase [Polymorphobacter fuscus]NJC08943.1 Zn-dependent M28 family amino/carboxypeptidase [Polymorphobacter fuscus]
MYRPARFLTPLFAIALTAAAPPPISATRIKADVATLASDAFAGRGPGEDGETKTIAFLQAEMAKAGLQPGGPDGQWLQPVPLVRLDRAPGATLTLTHGGAAHTLTLGRDATLGLRNPGRTRIADLPLVFAGFGIVGRFGGADYNPYKGIDMAGKVAVVLANDPDFEAGKDLGFEGRRLVIAGRIGSKFEAAARAGAAGILVIHEDSAASYPWLQVGSGDALPAMAAAPLKPSTLQLSGWLSGAAAADLLKAQNLDLAALKARSRAPGFAAFAMPGAALSADATLTATPVTSHNVIGRIPGATRPAEAILYGAHWDANGRNGPDATGDAIRNGAIDNATGTAELLEVARAFAAGPRPARSVIFAAWTAEEKGLIGSDHYAANPTTPLAATVAVINLDPHVALPAARNLELIGGGRTPLEDALRREAKDLGLTLVDEPNPEAGWYFRSDHYPFARRGVPSLAFRAGRDLVAGGFARGDAIVAEYNTNHYHQPSDSFHPDWDFTGTAQEATVAYRVGRALADSRDWPLWNAGSEFAPLRGPAPR